MSMAAIPGTTSGNPRGRKVTFESNSPARWAGTPATASPRRTLSSTACSEPISWKLGSKPDCDLGVTTAGGPCK
jgi:hypothetical protein